MKTNDKCVCNIDSENKIRLCALHWGDLHNIWEKENVTFKENCQND